jgi:uncharacterized protein (DUF1330 family)
VPKILGLKPRTILPSAAFTRCARNRAREQNGRKNMQAKYIVATAIGSFALGIGAASMLHAQGTAPYYEVAEINVKDQGSYEKSGVDKVREAIKALGGKVVAGGYNKTTSYMGSAPANRFLITMFPSKEAHDKFWAESAKPWAGGEGSKYADLRVIGVEGVEQK